MWWAHWWCIIDISCKNKRFSNWKRWTIARFHLKECPEQNCCKPKIKTKPDQWVKDNLWPITSHVKWLYLLWGLNKCIDMYVYVCIYICTHTCLCIYIYQYFKCLEWSFVYSQYSLNIQYYRLLFYGWWTLLSFWSPSWQIVIKGTLRTFLVVQWTRICLPMQGHSLSPGPGRFNMPRSNYEPVRHNYKPTCCSYWSLCV